MASRHSGNFGGDSGAVDFMRTLLILGTARSGTSWLGKIFDSHPWVAYRNEPDEILPESGLPYFGEGGDLARYAAVAERYVERLNNVRNTQTVGGFPIFRKAYRSLPAHWLRISWMLALRAPEIVPAGARAVRCIQIPEFARRRGEGPVLAVIKSVSLVDRAGLIAGSVPGLRTVLILRHPCASIASMLRGARRGKFRKVGVGTRIVETEWAQRHGLTRERFLAMPPYEQLAWHWLIRNEKAFDELSKLPNTRIVAYRDMVSAAEETARDLLAFAGLDWHPQTASFLQESQNSRGSRYYGVYRPAGFQQNADRWEDVLAPDQANRIFEVIANSPVAGVVDERREGTARKC
jgi:Sulfotransferase family